MLLLLLPIAASSASKATIVVDDLDGDVASITEGNCFFSTPTNGTWLEGEILGIEGVLHDVH